VRNTRRGYTLLELVLVLGVLGISAAIAVPSVRSMFGNSRQVAAADMIKARWADARSFAREQGKPYRFALVDGTGAFRVAPDSSEFWDGAPGATPEANTDGQQCSVIDGSLPREVKFSSAGNDAQSTQAAPQDGGAWANAIVFLPDGTARQDATVAFVETGNTRPLYLKLHGNTGATSTSYDDEGTH